MDKGFNIAGPRCGIRDCKARIRLDGQALHVIGL